MNIVFFGSSGFAVVFLKALTDAGHKITAVVTQPDRQKGRRLVVSPTPVKEAALAAGLPVVQPRRGSEGGLAETLKAYSADFFIVISYGEILPREVLDVPRYASLNVHPSLLPAYRGAAPINRALINGDTETGVSVIKMNDRMDAGDVVAQEKAAITSVEDAVSLEARLASVGARILVKAMDDIKSGAAVFTPQDASRVTFAPKLKKEEGLIDWRLPADDIRNLVRGTAPWPGAYTYLSKKKITIWKSAVSEGNGAPGEVAEAAGGSFAVGTGKGLLKIEDIQIEGKKRMDAASFLRGAREVKAGTRLGE